MQKEIEEKVSKLVVKLTKNKKTIATMESCTGGGVANIITNIPGASEVLKFSAVTYSNEYKIKMGVSKDVIDKYTVYSRETAVEMSRKISFFANSDFGVGVTGKFNCCDKANPYGDDSKVYVNIFDRENDMDYLIEVVVSKGLRSDNKLMVIEKVMDIMLEII